MKLVRTIPAAGIMPELYCFRCNVCGCPRTEELGSKAQQIAA
jgi:hypothetical protein